MEDRDFYWDHLKHEDTLFTSRTNFFLVGESMLLAGVTTLMARNTSDKLLVWPFCLLGLLVSGVWLFANLKHLRTTGRHVKKKLQKFHSPWSELARKRDHWPSVHKVVGIGFPVAFVVVWGYVLYVETNPTFHALVVQQVSQWSPGMESEWWFWLARVETVVVVLLAPFALWQFLLQRKATQDQTRATLHQIIATIISWVQAEEIRESRRLLFRLEDTRKISELPADRWEEEWKQAADRVSQSFNSAAIVAQQDPRLQEIWIRPTRRTIRRSWKIIQPRVKERRKEDDDLGKEFEWLAKKAREYCKPGEEGQT